ncbi:hypothetical protein E2562_001036 [Oryza meyeriana var. granulata]|uniref:KIB1-4 beta-propeller domain-containing protein n=1 Tax=Oryza meyeriana var. granulata TaxID=110450 RepID=A0A6G1ED07_9ORYZ|nr:hypothetical protein E2562_001036 [Oryza meyeriana var. granulata]
MVAAGDNIEEDIFEQVDNNMSDKIVDNLEESYENVHSRPNMQQLHSINYTKAADGHANLSLPHERMIGKGFTLEQADDDIINRFVNDLEDSHSNVHALPNNVQQLAHPRLLRSSQRTPGPILRLLRRRLGLLLSLHQADQHFLLSLHNLGQSIRLPNLFRLRYHLPPKPPREILHRIFIVAATLSRQPTEERCVAAGIMGFYRSPDDPWYIVFWQMGEQELTESFLTTEDEEELIVEDLLYSNGAGAFLFLTRGGHIREFHQPIFPLQDMRTEVLHFQPRGDDDDGGRLVLARYLVMSRGMLLMVIWLGTPQPLPWPTSAFRVFQREDRDVINDDGEVQAEHYWAKLPALDGRMLFVGRGCSRSYEAAHGYPGMEGVYFLDDRSFYDPMIMFRDDAERQYTAATSGDGRDHHHRSGAASRSKVRRTTSLRFGFSLE